MQLPYIHTSVFINLQTIKKACLAHAHYIRACLQGFFLWNNMFVYGTKVSECYSTLGSKFCVNVTSENGVFIFNYCGDFYNF